MTKKVTKAGLGKSLMAAAGVLVLSFGFSSQANAGAVIFANVLLENLSLTGTNDDGAVNLDFLGGLTLDGENSSTFGGADPSFSDSAPPGVGIDPLQACFASDGLNGTGCPAQNTFTPQAVIGDEFSRADLETTNNLLDGNATVDLVAEIQLDSTIQDNTGNTLVNLVGAIGEGPSGANPLVNNTQLTLSFDATAFLNAFLHEEAIPISGGAISINAEFVVRDATGAIVAQWVPGGIATGLSAETDPLCTDGNGLGTQSLTIDAILIRDATSSCGGSWSVTTNDLPNGFYQISLLLRIDSSLRATKAVPEPSALLLMGVGLLGLGAVAARRRKAA